jgi:predicted MFS family arabinose efflux permease
MTSLQTTAVSPAALSSYDVVRPPLVSRALLVRFVSIVGSSVGFYLPLSVVPLVAAESGSAGSAGLATVALLVATVACELVTPRLVARVGYRWALGLGLTLLGAPTVVLAFCSAPVAVLAVSVLRGAGFAVSVTAGGAVTASLIPAERRGEGLALVGLVGGVPGMLALPAGLWMTARWGYGPVFVSTAVVTLLALLSVPGLPSRAASAQHSAERAPASHGGVLAGLRDHAVRRPAVVFASSTAAVGVLVTFLPLAVRGAHAWVAAAALLAQPAASTAARWWAGRVGDRRGQAGLLVPGLLLAVAGMLGVAVTSSPAAVVGGAMVFGAGFGILQNATLSLMYARAAGCEDVVSAIWNAAYDLGMAAGALVAGLVVAHAGYAATFVLSALVMVPAMVVARRR